MSRKPWMDSLQSYRFTRCGSMTTETARAWRDHSDRTGPSEFSYARALGITVEEAEERIGRQKAIQILEEVQDTLPL